MEHLGNYEHTLGQDSHKYFHNLCIEFKKFVQKSKDPALLEIEMERLINASKQMKWKREKQEIWKKDAGEKAMGKLWNEFSRYVLTLKKNPEKADAKDLIEALCTIESLVEQLKVV